MTVQSSQEDILSADPAAPSPPAVEATIAPVETSLTPRRITFPNKNSALLVTPPPEAEADAVLAALELETPNAVLLMVGDAEGLDELVEAHLVQLFSRGIARAAANTEAAIIDGGRHSGIVAMMGQGVADRGYRTALVGVAPVEKIIEPGKAVAALENGREPLDPNHGYFVLTDGSEWGDESEMMFRLAEKLGQNGPIITVLVNGRDRTDAQIIRAVRNNWPVIVIKGSGGLADRIAELRHTRPSFISDPELAEIIIDGNLHIVQLDGSIGAFERLLEQLTSRQERVGMETLELAWKTFAMYDANANRQQDSHNHSQSAALALGVLGTFLVIVQKQLELSGNPLAETIAEDILTFIILLIPITVTFLIALSNRFSAGNKWILSRAGAESIKKEIYRYRARAEIYGDEQTKNLSRDLKLTRKIEAVSTKLMQTDVNTSAIREYTGSIPPQYGSAEGDDGLSYLAPDRYLKLRLQDQLSYYRRKAEELEARLQRLQWIIYLAGAAGTLLVAIDLALWVALTTTIATSLTTYLQYQKVEEKLMRYNQTATDLMNVQNWWMALSPEEQANPENLDKLVGQTETTIHSEHAAWVQEMQDALAELRAEQTRVSSEAEAVHSTEQKLVSIKR